MYNTCFGCGEDNPSGLQMKREYETDGSVISKIAIDEKYAGDKGVVHGGIQATLLDEVLGFAVRKVSEDNYGELKPIVTATFQLKYKAPCPTNTELIIRSRITKLELPSVFVEGEICNAAGDVLTRAEARWRIMGV
jgi:acyl-coenzyme A thioesterase PaaI-like protein